MKNKKRKICKAANGLDLGSALSNPQVISGLS